MQISNYRVTMYSSDWIWEVERVIDATLLSKACWLHAESSHFVAKS